MRTITIVALLLMTGAGTALHAYTDLDDPTDPWLTSRTGISTDVPSPFEPLSVDGSNVSCWGRTYGLAAPLPTTITSDGEALLAGPMRVIATVGGQETVLSGLDTELTAVAGDRVEFTGACPAGAATIQSTGWLEYDGAMQVRLTVQGNVSLERLAIEIPMRPEIAKLFYVGHQWGETNYERVGDEADWGWETGWQGNVWLGDDYRGLTFITESYQDWVGENDGRLRIERAENAVLFRATIVSEAVQIEGERTWTMGLQATPGKSLPTGWHGRHVGHFRITDTPEEAQARADMGVRVSLIWNDNTKWFSFPEARDPEQFTAAVKAYHDAGIRVVVYVNFSALGLASEVFKRHYDEWLLSNKGEPLYASTSPDAREIYTSACAGGGYTDWLVWAVDRAMEDYDIDGIYVDNTGPYYCDNVSHGCGPDRSWPFFDTRDLHKRLWTVIHTRKPEDGIIWEHNSRTSNSFNLTFVDIYSDGEHFRVKSKGRPEEITRTLLDITGTGRQWGSQACFLASALNAREEYTDWLLARLLPFGNVLLLNPKYMDFSRISPVLAARIDFGLDRDPVEWYTPEKLPDWLPLTPEELLYGAYVREDGSVLLTIGNPTDTFVAMRMDLRPVWAKMGEGMAITDATTGFACPPIGKTLMLSVPSNSFRVILLEPPVATE